MLMKTDKVRNKMQGCRISIQNCYQWKDSNGHSWAEKCN